MAPVPNEIPAPAPDQGVATSHEAPAPVPVPGAPVGTAPIDLGQIPAPGVETLAPGGVPMPGGPVPGAPVPQPVPGAAPVPAAAPAGPDKVEMILAVLAFVVTVGAVVLLALMKVE